MADQKLEMIVQRMINAGEDEDAVASVIRAYGPQRSSDSGAAVTFALGKLVPSVENAALRMATSPTVPRTMASVGRVLGGIAPVVGGGVKAGPGGAALGMAGVAPGAWAGGRTGWFTGKLIQQMANPVARVLSTAAPYAQALSALSGAQGVGNLAQMAEPNRNDIGFLGMGYGEPRSAAEQAAHPALINALVRRMLGQ